jgi:hypothetical protein
MQRRSILCSLANHRNDMLDRVTAYSGWAAQIFVNDPKHPAAHDSVAARRRRKLVGVIIP